MCLRRTSASSPQPSVFSSVANIAGPTAARDIAEVPSFSRVGGEAPGSRVAIGVSAVIFIKVFFCKTGKRVKPLEFGIETLSSLNGLVKTKGQPGF